MSYDLFAFDPGALAPDDDVMAWYQKQAEWSEPHSYTDAAVSTPKLQAFYRDLIKVFPPMNGPDAAEGDDEADTDYAIGTTILYVAFRWSKAEDARAVFVRLGQAHGVGVCEISETPAAVHRPPGEAAGQAKSGAAAISAGTRSAPGVAARETGAAAKPASGSTEEKRNEGQLYL
jgi:hypothetical protein